MPGYRLTFVFNALKMAMHRMRIGLITNIVLQNFQFSYFGDLEIIFSDDTVLTNIHDINLHS